MTDLIRGMPPIDQILRWLVEGASVTEILATISQEWPDADAEVLYGEALLQIEQAAKVNPQVVKGWTFMARQEIFRRAMEIGDLGIALRAVDKIDGMFQ